MDFGDILKTWDDLQKNPSQKKNQVSHKKANAPTKDEKAAHIQGYSYEEIMAQNSMSALNAQEIWMRKFGTVDKDKIIEETEAQKKFSDANYLRALAPQASVDLHQLTQDEAWQKLESFVSVCKKRGLKKILIIHGKGNHSHGTEPVLGKMVRLFIEQDKRLGISGHPDRNHGGNGATWVVIK
jgi:DNA-nicking Smr family endonuclease